MVTNCVTRHIMVAVWVVATVVLPQVNTSAGAAGSTRVFVLPDAHAEPVRSLLRGARQSIRLEIYLLTNRALIGELQRARQRGVDVRVLLEEHPFGGSRYAQLGYRALQQAGVPVRWANERAYRFTHDKAVTVDGQIAGIFSFNLTSSGLLRNREFGVIDSDANDARALSDVFDADWSRRAAHYRPSHLVISPYNSRRSFYALVGSAHRTLELYAEEVNDTATENRLVAAARRGVRVHLITSQAGPGVDALRRGGVSVHVVSSPYIHAKAIVTDRAALFIGSENISTTSLDQNREIGVLLHDQIGISTVESTFTSDWRRAAAGVSAPTNSPSTSTTVHVTATPSVVHRDSGS